MQLPVISIRRPWSRLIVGLPHLPGPKDIENRPRRWRHRGLILIHCCASNPTGSAIAEAHALIRRLPPEQQEAARELVMASLLEEPIGGIVGIAQLTGCTTSSTSPWFTGLYGLHLAKRTCLPFLPCKGQLGQWKFDYPAHLLPPDIQALA